MSKIVSCGCESCFEKLCAHKVPILSALNISELAEITKLIVHKTYSKGECIIFDGQKVDSLNIINKGQVKVYTYSDEGKEQILYIFAEGDFFGEKNLLKDQTATYFVETLDNTMICSINKQDFRKMLSEHTDISLKIIEALSERMETLENALHNMGTKSIEARISLLLLEFSAKYGTYNKEGILLELPLSREGIASYIGATRETVSRKLSLLQEEGIIEMIGHKKIMIKNQKLLEDSTK